jgi:hypothetical protein
MARPFHSTQIYYSDTKSTSRLYLILHAAYSEKRSSKYMYQFDSLWYDQTGGLNPQSTALEVITITPLMPFGVVD